jgi:hypothetical protein
MKGKLVKKEDTWYITRLEENEWETYYPLHEDSVNEINGWEQVFDNVDARIANNQEVEFHFHELWEEVDGKTKVTKTAKLGPVPTDENNYPLIQGTMDICNEMIYNREISDEQAIEMVKDMNKQPMRFHCVPKEISDEEIDEQAELIEQGIYRMFFKTGAKWYREQLKNKK